MPGTRRFWFVSVDGLASDVTAFRRVFRDPVRTGRADQPRLRRSPLVRRGRALARTEETLTAGMFLVGMACNFCWEHESLRRET